MAKNKDSRNFSYEIMSRPTITVHDLQFEFGDAFRHVEYKVLIPLWITSMTCIN